ncbi:DUF3822 family protein [Algibacter luteus]|uniref:DUF3822 family protein n=1 Tax=Algibacter luteus TaxID=1178825 RepID=UPI002595BB46|nr:DUF3822 family protein [Algibacter luteus]WJJ95363.1 DUF3822 family protein [Algibacter luteus]
MKLTQTETGQKHMAQTNKTTNKLTNIDLSIQISLSGLSFCILNTDTNTVIELREVIFEKRLNPLEALDELKSLFTKENALQSNFKNVIIIHDNDLATLVPKSLFNKNHLAEYLKFNSKILKSDFIAYDPIQENTSVNVYIPYVNFNNFIYEKFGAFVYKHVSTVLIENILQIEKESETPKVFVNISTNHFEILVTEKEQLNLYNSFSYSTKEDFIYYILFTAEQLNLDPESFQLVLLGDVDENNELYEIAYKYIRNISFGKRNSQYKYIAKPKSEYSNFALLNSF